VTLAAKVAMLEAELGRLPSLMVALSGGVDSAVLAVLAGRSVRGRIVAATTVSAAVPPEEIETARAVAESAGIPHLAVRTDELSDPAYRANDASRCFHCRQSMYGALREAARGEGIVHIADGLQADDLVADRAGVRAAQEHGILHPLRSAALGKAEIRRLAWGMALEVHDKPAQPCLASRVQRGVEVTEERLARVLRAERAVAGLGYRVLRVRCEAAHARIEIGRADLERALRDEQRLVSAALTAGFRTAAVDPAGYRGA
jgi:uncharacterized protein